MAAKQNNYFLSRRSTAPDLDATNARFVGLGLLYKAGLIKHGEGPAFFCPSFTDLNHQFDVPTNPWPPSTVLPSETGTRTTYSVRPKPLEDGGDVIWTASGPMYPQNMLGQPAKFPRLSQFKNLAIISDINSSATRIPIAHVKGINVLYGNGGAKWVDKGGIDQ